MCAMKDEDADDRPEGLSKAEAEEMCTGPMKEYTDSAYSTATQLLARTPFSVYHGLRNAIAAALRQGKRITPNDLGPGNAGNPVSGYCCATLRNLNMKITKQRLKEIIKEELGSLSEEENYGGRVPTYPELKRHPPQSCKTSFWYPSEA